MPAAQTTMPQAAPGSAYTNGQGNVAQMISVVRDSISPAQREWAILSVASMDLRRNPEIMEVVLTTARQDPAATVRAACVHVLARQELNLPPVVVAFQALKDDPDPRVRQEVEQALVRFGTPATATPAAVQPVRNSQ
jgi:hypothetical protein